MLLIGLNLPGAGIPQLIWATGAGVLLVAIPVVIVALGHRGWCRLRGAAVRRFIDADHCSVVITDAGGQVLMANAESERQFGIRENAELAQGLTGLYAAPATTLRDLTARAGASGLATTDRVCRNGQIRLSVAGLGDGTYRWRLEDMSPKGAQIGLMAIGLPMVVVSDSGRILARNPAMDAVIDPEAVQIDAVVAGREIQSGDVHTIATRDGSQRFRVLDLGAEASGSENATIAGNRELYLLPPNFGGVDSTQRLFDTLPVPLLKISASGVVLVANQSVCALLGRDIQQGTWLSDLVSGLGRSVTEWLQDAAAGRGLNQSEFLQVRGRDSDLFVQVSLKRVVEQGEKCLVAVLTDATELKTLEAQFVQSQKMQAIGQLAGGVAHDFNNLLTAISGHCDLLLLRHDQGDPEYGDLVQIHQNANRAASLVGQLLAFSRKQTLQPEVIDLRDALSDLTHLLSRLVGERVQLTLRHHRSLPSIRADKRQLEQVIMNLVVNARDAMPDGGEVVLETETVGLEQDLRRNRAVIPAGEYVLVRVADQGMGIPAENLQKIFEPFYTTKKTGEGTGLGLSTVYGIVKQTGGFIFVESGKGTGTVFTLYFPAFSPETQTATPAVARPRLPDPASRRDGVVLLVEDEAPVRAFASRALRLRGYTVLEADNAEAALSILSDPSLSVDVFVTDVVMPGMDGPTWVREALVARPETRVVFVSGYSEDALTDLQERIPNSIFLPKPFSLQELTATVQRQMG
ncbi:ATP-binding protein [Pseudoruegeria sp. SK021]|uniref:ATP-binding response regulator n=1 Tax=Pseudoruegeria sp. SK021 TaxID=1933035 RepID=UPI001981C669|nr:ATP-binding protein [Pseudoruegeria sp. SK021]